MKPSKAYRDQVFLNCPFDDAYRSLFDAIIFSVLACGFVIRSARERDDAGEPRFSKIVEIIRSSMYGIHDISRVELDPEHHLPRFNMPLELGLFLGAKSFATGGRPKKHCLIFDCEAYRYQKFVSDIAGQDIRSHHNDPMDAIVETRHWLATMSKKALPGTNKLKRAYEEFSADLPAILAKLELAKGDLRFAEYVKVAGEWLHTHP